jgi:hypothetical protein
MKSSFPEQSSSNYADGLASNPSVLSIDQVSKPKSRNGGNISRTAGAVLVTGLVSLTGCHSSKPAPQEVTVINQTIVESVASNVYEAQRDVAVTGEIYVASLKKDMPFTAHLNYNCGQDLYYETSEAQDARTVVVHEGEVLIGNSYEVSTFPSYLTGYNESCARSLPMTAAVPLANTDTMLRGFYNGNFLQAPKHNNLGLFLQAEMGISDLQVDHASDRAASDSSCANVIRSDVKASALDGVNYYTSQNPMEAFIFGNTACGTINIYAF